MFDPSIATLLILLRLLGSAMLSAGLSLAISNIRAKTFEARIPGLL